MNTVLLVGNTISRACALAPSISFARTSKLETGLPRKVNPARSNVRERCIPARSWQASFSFFLIIAATSLVLMVLSSQRSFGIDQDLRRPASWQWPPREVLEKQWTDYLAQRSDTLLNPAEQIMAHWKKLNSAAAGPELLDHALATLALVDDRFHRVLTQINQTGPPVGKMTSVDLSWLDASIPSWIQANLQLAYARSLAHHQFYDEAAKVLTTINLKDVADPSTLLFYRAVTFHHLLQKDECLMAVTQLLERESELASRYAVTARLMKSDIEPLKEDTLDEISRLMNDVQRRLELGRSGKIVRDQEQQIVEKLDKMIDKIEQQIQEQKKQQQQQQQQQQQSKDQKNPSQGKPMEDSQIAGNSGPGDVDPKSLGKSSGWGDLPPAQRQEALQNMTKDLPSHYREVIEAYFKTLATDSP